MTEAEAATKWCPFAKELTGRTAKDDPCNNGTVNFTCIGNRCACWQLLPDTRTSITVTIENGTESSSPPRATDGFCGLAGRP